MRLDGQWSLVLGAGGGCTGIHSHSAVAQDDNLYLAIGDRLACLNLATGQMTWSRYADRATCFGVHWDLAHQALLSHGELAVSRFSSDGTLLWRVEGTDIFTGKLECLPDAVRVTDFDGTIYLLDHLSGAYLSNV